MTLFIAQAILRLWHNFLTIWTPKRDLILLDFVIGSLLNLIYLRSWSSCVYYFRHWLGFTLPGSFERIQYIPTNALMRQLIRQTIKMDDSVFPAITG